MWGFEGLYRGFGVLGLGFRDSACEGRWGELGFKGFRICWARSFRATFSTARRVKVKASSPKP